jgi:hypothetical protein
MLGLLITKEKKLGIPTTNQYESQYTTIRENCNWPCYNYYVQRPHMGGTVVKVIESIKGSVFIGTKIFANWQPPKNNDIANPTKEMEKWPKAAIFQGKKMQIARFRP